MELPSKRSLRTALSWTAAISFAIACLSVTGCGRPPAESNGTPEVADPTAGTGEIHADPNPVPAGGQLGKTTISWKSDTDTAEIAVSVNGAAEQIFARSKEGSSIAPWIPAGFTEFRLYSGPKHSKILARVTVTRAD
jgi:hypothetical protein